MCCDRKVILDQFLFFFFFFIIERTIYSYMKLAHMYCDNTLYNLYVMYLM